MTFNIANLRTTNKIFNINKLQPEGINVDYAHGMYIVIINGIKHVFDDYGSAKELIEESFVG